MSSLFVVDVEGLDVIVSMLPLDRIRIVKAAFEDFMDIIKPSFSCSIEQTGVTILVDYSSIVDYYSLVSFLD